MVISLCLLWAQTFPSMKVVTRHGLLVLWEAAQSFIVPSASTSVLTWLYSQPQRCPVDMIELWNGHWQDWPVISIGLQISDTVNLPSSRPVMEQRDRTCINTLYGRTCWIQFASHGRFTGCGKYRLLYHTWRWSSSQTSQEQAWQPKIYLTAFGVFRRPPWKELSCKMQTALAEAQQEHGFCVKHGVCKEWFWVQQSFWLNQGGCVYRVSTLESPCSTFMAKQRRQKKA